MSECDTIARSKKQGVVRKERHCMQALTEGQKFERYRVIRWLGRGTSGESYEAEDTFLQRKAVLKLIHPWGRLADAARRQFFREMQSSSLFTHRYLAAMLDYGEVEGQLYIARRYSVAGSLLGNDGRNWFRPPLPLADALHYTHQLAQALHYIHSYGHVHGSLTLSNVLVLHGPAHHSEETAAPFLLADVGITHFVRRFGQPQTPLLPITAAPEQLEQRTTPASDQYSLAVLFYLWLAGRPPFLGSPEEIAQLKRMGAITLLSSLNPQVTLKQEGVLQRALSVHPEERYPSILAFAEALLASYSPTTEHQAAAESAVLPPPLSTPATAPVPMTPSQDVTGAEDTSSLVSEPTAGAIHQTAAGQTAQPIQPTQPAEPTQTTEDAQAAQTSSDAVSKNAWDSLLGRDLRRESVFTSSVEEQSTPPEPVPQRTPDVPLPVPEPETQPSPEALPSQESPALPPTEQPEEAPLPEPLPQPAPDVFTPLPEPPPPSEAIPDVEQPVQQAEHSSATGKTGAFLIITHPSLEGPHMIPLEQDEITIGRAGSSDILLDQDSSTSRHHALLKREEGHYVIYDRRSANGVLVNGQQIASESAYALEQDDHITIGDYELIYQVHSLQTSSPQEQQALYQS